MRMFLDAIRSIGFVGCVKYAVKSYFTLLWAVIRFCTALVGAIGLLWVIVWFICWLFDL